MEPLYSRYGPKLANPMALTLQKLRQGMALRYGGHWLWTSAAAGRPDGEDPRDLGVSVILSELCWRLKTQTETETL